MGVLSILLGGIGLGGVLCLLFPAQLSTPLLREQIPLEFVREAISACLLASFTFGSISVLFNREKKFGALGMALTFLALLLGGSGIPIRTPIPRSAYLGLDWALLNLLVLSLIFVPMELLFRRRRRQQILRPGWTTDLAHFFASHLLVQLVLFLTVLPARGLFSWAVNDEIQGAVSAQHFLLQFLAIVLLTDLAQYWIHRMFHQVPLLWRFHAIHHSARHLDWLASSRLHLLDIVVTRGATFVPLFVLGFANGPILAYLVFVSFHAVFNHANVRLRFGPLENWVATPRFHHWHHSSQREARDKNFAVHLPMIDRVFGTAFLPANRWPSTYGIPGHPVPDRFLPQLMYPFALKKSGL